MKQIKVTITPAGEVKAAAAGYAGAACLEATRFVESLGAKTADEPTTEMFEAPKLEETA